MYIQIVYNLQKVQVGTGAEARFGSPSSDTQGRRGRKWEEAEKGGRARCELHLDPALHLAIHIYVFFYLFIRLYISLASRLKPFA